MKESSESYSKHMHTLYAEHPGMFEFYSRTLDLSGQKLSEWYIKKINARHSSLFVDYISELKFLW